MKELKWKRYKRKRSARDHSSSSDGSGSVRHADHSADPAPAGDRARTQEPSSSSAGASAECLSTRWPRGAASSRVGSAGVQQFTSLDLVLQPLVADSKIRHVYRRVHASAITVQTLAERPSASCVVPAAPCVTPAATGMVSSPSVEDR